MTTIKAHFDGKTFVPDEPVVFPANTPVTLHVDLQKQGPLESIEERLKALDELAALAEQAEASSVDWSRESIYTGTLDDPR